MIGNFKKLKGLLTYFPKEAYFVFFMFLNLLVLFTILRLSFYMVNSSFLTSNDEGLLLNIFTSGLRFDVAVSSIIAMIYFFILAMTRKPKVRSIVLSLFTFFVCLLLLVLVGEAEYYNAFETRYNFTILEYFKDIGSLVSFVWANYPVFMYSILWLILVLILTAGQSFLFHTFLRDYPPYGETGLEVFKRGLIGLLLFIVMFIGIRGGLGANMISCTDSDHLGSKFAMDLSQNGAFTLGATLLDNNAKGCIYIKQKVPNIIIFPEDMESYISDVG